MDRIATHEQALYAGVWESVDDYGTYSPGVLRLPVFLDMLTAHGYAADGSVLDAGCGSGAGGLALRAAGFRVELADFTTAGLTAQAQDLVFHDVCLWQAIRLGRFFDWVYCADVLEHIPEALTMLTVFQLLRIARKGVFLTISTTDDNFGQLVGEPLHKTVHNFLWWRDLLRCVGDVREARDLLICGAYLVVPRC